MKLKEEAKVQFKTCLQELATIWATPEGKSLSEAMTRHLFIDKYVDYLGYKGMADLELEHPVKDRGKFIDYVLKIGGELAIALEAKPLNVPLSDEVGAQLLEYQVVENIEWGIATNGRELWLYNYLLQGPTRDKCVMKLDFLPDDLDAKLDALFDRLWLLSKESMLVGVGLRSLIKNSQLERAMEGAVLDKTSKVVRALRIDVRERTQGKIKVTPDEVVSWLRNLLARGLAPLTGTATEAALPSAPSSARPKPERSKAAKKSLQQMKLAGKAFPLRHSYEILVNTANWLISEGNLKTSDCPVEIGAKRNLVNTQPKHKHGDDFKRPKMLSTGMWIEVNYSTKECINNAKRLLERFGYPPDILEIE